jgi:RNA polymerase sigma-70 factor (ECF subfamily)
MTTSLSSAQVTQLLHSWSEGNQAALEKITSLIYAELHRLARGYMWRERGGHTVQTTALINEPFLKLTSWKNARWQFEQGKRLAPTGKK